MLPSSEPGSRWDHDVVAWMGGVARPSPLLAALPGCPGAWLPKWLGLALGALVSSRGHGPSTEPA